MTTHVEIAGRIYVVSVRPSRAGRPGVFTVNLHQLDEVGPSEAPFEIEARQTATGSAFVYLSDGRQIDAAVTPLEGGQVLVQWGAKDLTVQVRHRRPLGATREHGHAGEVRVAAPMPGRIVRVLVTPGDTVVARQGLVVVEAMKMENELGAPRGGRVREVTVTEGTSVESGRVLVVIE